MGTRRQYLTRSRIIRGQAQVLLGRLQDRPQQAPADRLAFLVLRSALSCHSLRETRASARAQVAAADLATMIILGRVSQDDRHSPMSLEQRD